MSVLSIHLERTSDLLAIGLVGELDIATVGRLEQAIREVEGEPRVCLDLSGLRFIDSTGLRVLLVADAAARAAGRELILRRGPDRVQRAFRLARLEERLSFVPRA